MAMGFLLAATLLVKALVPSGWMPVASEQGVRIALCTDHGAVTLVMDAKGRLHQDAPQPQRDPCPFGLAAAKALDLPEAIELPLPPAALAAMLAPALITAKLLAWRSLRPPARGPPALA